MKINIGDIFSIQTKKGFGYLQYIQNTEFGEYVRILDYISNSKTICQEEVDKTERWCITFTIKSAIKKKIIEFVDNFNLPNNFEISNFARSQHNIRGEFIGWHIINRKTLQRELKTDLSEEEMKLSPHGFMNDTLIIEMLENGWKLSEWK